MRRVGCTYQQIADHLNISQPAAYTLVRRALADIPMEAGKEVLQLELDRLDALYQAALPYALGMPEAIIEDERGRKIGYRPPVAPDASFMGRCLEIQARRAKYLGLDAPVRVALIEAEAERLAELTGIPKEKILARANGIMRLVS